MFRLTLILTTLFLANISYALTFNQADSPYFIDSNIVFNSEETVVFEEGTIFILSPEINITIKGSAIFNGTSSNPIQFLPLISETGWGSIILGDSDSDNIIHYNLKYLNIIDGRIETNNASVQVSNLNFTNSQNLNWNDVLLYIKEGNASITNCQFNGTNKGEGVQFLRSSNIDINNCFFYSIPDAIELISVFAGEISHNTIINSEDDGIDLNNSKNIIISHNYIHNIEDRGMEIGSENNGSSLNILIHNNVISDCNEGVIFKEESSGKLINNTFYNNYTALVSQDLAGNKGSSVEVFNTIFSNSINEDIRSDQYSNLYVNYSLSDNNLLAGDSNLFEEPEFVDEYNENFELAPISPCIDKGNPIFIRDKDCSRSDIGALYFHQSENTCQLDYLRVIPSLFALSTSIVYELEELSNVKINIYDMGTSNVYVLLEEYQEKGLKNITWTAPYSNTIYLIELYVNNIVYRKKAICIN
tara:strand:- start:851 stop:2272 length:1422 start_codon:yes stop_codon:yes gene_type:complete